MKHTSLLLPPLAVAVLVSATLAVGAGHASGSSALLPSGSSTATPKPPVVVGGLNKHGVQMSAEERKLRQQRRKIVPLSQLSTHHPQPRNKDRNAKRDGQDSDREPQRPFRLNMGICGRMQPDGRVPGPNWCQPVLPDDPQATRRPVPRQAVRPRPQDVTWEQVLGETKDVLFPGLSVKVQPKGRTLVNLDTIVYTDESKVSTTTITLLGFPVQVEATPLSYIWNFGDGSPVLTTTTPGKPYPSKEITHKYMKRGAVTIALTTNYAARFNVAGTGWQYTDGTVPIEQ